MAPNIVRMIKSRRLRWAGHVARMENGRCAFKQKGKPTERRLLGRPRRRWEDNVRVVLKKCVSIGTIGLIQFRTGIIREPL